MRSSREPNRRTRPSARSAFACRPDQARPACADLPSGRRAARWSPPISLASCGSLYCRTATPNGAKMSKLRLSITMSLDGYVAGPDQNEENPLGIGGMELHEWVFPLKAFREMHGQVGGDVNASSAVVEERRANIGATIMGR